MLLNHLLLLSIQNLLKNQKLRNIYLYLLNNNLMKNLNHRLLNEFIFRKIKPFLTKLLRFQPVRFKGFGKELIICFISKFLLKACFLLDLLINVLYIFPFFIFRVFPIIINTNFFLLVNSYLYILAFSFNICILYIAFHLKIITKNQDFNLRLWFFLRQKYRFGQKNEFSFLLIFLVFQPVFTFGLLFQFSVLFILIYSKFPLRFLLNF